MDPAQLTDHLRTEARTLGFPLVGACPAVPPPGLNRFVQWLKAGYAGPMQYFHKRFDAYRHPSSILPGARSLLVLGLPYRTVDPQPASAEEAMVARYAWSDVDYHDVIRGKLRHLGRFARQLAPHVHTRGVVDTAPLLEREYGALAGLGWIAKNTMLINRQYGSWFFLAALLLDCPLQYDQPLGRSYCGTCTACLQACPTGAFVQPGVLDARRCISCWTIEQRGPLPSNNRSAVKPWLFGCDVCQNVCPWNRKAKRTEDHTFAPRPDLNPVVPADWFHWDEAAFGQRFRRTALWRARRSGLLRNAALALAGSTSSRALHSLLVGLHDQDPVVRGACAWALGRHPAPDIRAQLRQRLAVEQHPDVLRELAAAVGTTESSE
jgi:epoxyqueuosine reductase